MRFGRGRRTRVLGRRSMKTRILFAVTLGVPMVALSGPVTELYEFSQGEVADANHGPWDRGDAGGPPGCALHP